MAGKEFGAIALALAVLAGCGDDPIEERAAEPRIRVVDAVSSTASCAEGEQLLSAYCFSDAGRSLSASGPAIQADTNGLLGVSCLSGGANVRLVCLTP